MSGPGREGPDGDRRPGPPPPRAAEGRDAERPSGPPPPRAAEGRDAERPSGPPPREINIAGVKLFPAGRTIECDAGALKLVKGDLVVVEDQHGSDVATVTVRSALRPVRGPLRRILRVAGERDLERRTANEARAAEALAMAREGAKALRLPIKVFRAEAGGGGRVLLTFSSEARIDFRELVRELGVRLRARIEMRQVGVRDEAKMIGAIGSCGLELCCTTFLPHFAPVSIKMAKHQNIVLNPAKVTGQCGRLKCCLVYEDALYVELGRSLPKMGKRVETPDGAGRVGDLDVLKGRVRVYFPDQPPRVYAAADVRPMAPPPGPGPRAGPGGPPPAHESDGDDDGGPPSGVPTS